MIRLRPVIVLGAVAIASSLGVFAFFRAEDHPVAKEPAPLTVTVARPRPGRIADAVSVTGMTVPREEIQVMTELANVRVADVRVEVGDRVRKGQKLAVLDGASLAYQMLPLKSDYERARDAYARVEQIKDSGAVSQQLVQEKRAEMQAAKAKLADAELSLKRATVLAPEAGLVFERKAVIGGLVTASEPLFRIARRQEIEVEALVPESLLAALQPGQSASVTLTGATTASEGAIRLVTPRVDRTTRMATIRIGLVAAQPVPVGLFASVRLVLAEREGMLLPRTALQHDGVGDFVWVLNAENKATRLPVSVAQRGPDQIVVEAIALDSRVVARAGAFLRDGESVRAIEGP